MSFDEKTAQVIFGKNVPGLFLYYDKNAENASALLSVFSEVAAEVKGEIQAIKTGITQGLETRLAEYIGITASDLPTVRITDTRVDMKKYNLQGEITADNIRKFVKDWQSGALKQSLKSEEIPAEQTENVYVLVGKSFDSIVLDETKDVLVKFYAPWCGHCKKIAPIYEELATKLKHNKNLIIAKIDSTTNETDKVSIQGFPTIKFFPAGKKSSPIDFDGDRTVEGFEAFLNKHASVPLSNNKDDL
jgi:protein disulfide isomerase